MTRPRLDVGYFKMSQNKIHKIPTQTMSKLIWHGLLMTKTIWTKLTIVSSLYHSEKCHSNTSQLSSSYKQESKGNSKTSSRLYPGLIIRFCICEYNPLTFLTWRISCRALVQYPDDCNVWTMSVCWRHSELMTSRLDSLDNYEHNHSLQVLDGAALINQSRSLNLYHKTAVALWHVLVIYYILVIHLRSKNA